MVAEEALHRPHPVIRADEGEDATVRFEYLNDLQPEERKIHDIQESGETFGSLKRSNSRFGLSKEIGDEKEIYRVSTAFARI